MSDELPPKGDAKQTAEKSETADPNQSTIETAAEKIIAALTRIDRANRKANAAENERNHRREQRRFVIEKIEIVLIAVYAVFTILEWNIFNSERITMESEFKSNQKGTLRQLDEIMRTRVLDERAWVFVEIADNNLIQHSNSLTFSATIKNIGKTPAILTGSWERITTNTNDIWKPDPKVGGASTMVVPNSIWMLPSPQIPIDSINSGLPIYFFGIVYYRDIFTNAHWTQFCFQITKGGQVVYPVPFHNSCDDAETDQSNQN